MDGGKHPPLWKIILPAGTVRINAQMCEGAGNLVERQLLPAFPGPADFTPLDPDRPGAAWRPSGAPPASARCPGGERAGRGTGRRPGAGPGNGEGAAAVFPEHGDGPSTGLRRTGVGPARRARPASS
ncbi:hypothetical protein GCM10009665_58210 [Kitasatospora nipponensis]|uniref:Uncharacterized protein n=1 Tax=Kitasatospora nipponensis TaxID=258049 RepID=A0ABN1WQW2_9ACTN